MHAYGSSRTKWADYDYKTNLSHDGLNPAHFLY